MNVPPLQIAATILVTPGVGLTVTVTVNVAPVHPADVGVTFTDVVALSTSARSFSTFGSKLSLKIPVEMPTEESRQFLLGGNPPAP